MAGVSAGTNAVGRRADGVRRGGRFLEDHGNAALGLILVGFALVHLARVDRVLALGDGINYLRGAVRVAAGELPSSQYSPGVAYLLAPLAKLMTGEFRLFFVTVGLLNIVVTVTALALLHRFLRTYLGEVPALALVAIVALGETATNALIGAEIEPLSLLIVVGTLFALQQGRMWAAVVVTGLGVMCRIALGPFLGLLWLLHWRRSRRPATVALGLLALDLAVFLLFTQRSDTTYFGIAGGVYGGGADSGFLSSLVDVGSKHIFRYSHFGVPAIVWPSALLSSPVGYLFGLSTSLCVVVGGWSLFRSPPAGDTAGLLRPAFVAGAVYLGLLFFWPANDPALIRLSIPLAPLVLLATTRGLQVIARRFLAARAPLFVAVATATALLAAVTTTTALVATRRTTEPKVAAFLEANRRAGALAPPGAILSRLSGLTELTSGRRGIAYRNNATLDQALELARSSGACTIVLENLRGRLSPEIIAFATEDPSRQILAVGGTRVLRLDGPTCGRAAG